MQSNRRKSLRDRGGGGLVWQCLLFWFAPVVFLSLCSGKVVTSGEGEVHGNLSITAVAPPLAILIALSVLNFVLDVVVGCRAGFPVLQVVLQSPVLMYCFSQIDPVLPPPLAAQPKRLQAALRRQALEAPQSAATPAPTPASALQGSAEPSAGGEQADTISVVLPCLNETTNAINTVKSFCDRTPSNVLEEIVVVDDGSSPPLEKVLEGQVDLARCRVRFLRHSKPWGLMIAKQTGGDAARGKYIGFYDCHVAPRRGWHEETVSLLRANPKRLVVPMIGDLDMNTWDEKPGGALTTKCYINFNADFWWYDDDSDFIPVISGGLVATSRLWWQMSGGFDSQMRGWGGENTDQSLRAWLCGGDIVRAKTSVIAHMWRVSHDSRTAARYRFRGQTDNLARVAMTWFDDFTPKFRSGMVPWSDVSAEKARKEAAGCKPFIYFLHRFRRVYVDGGILPERVFKLRNVEDNTCLAKQSHSYLLGDCKFGAWFHLANQIPPDFPENIDPDPDSDKAVPGHQVTCGGHMADRCADCPQGHGASWCNVDCTWVFGACVRKPREQPKPSGERKRCCSGIREWNSMNCFDQLQEKGPLPYKCDLMGGNTNQQYVFDRDGKLRHQSGKCLGVGPPYVRKKGFRPAAIAMRHVKPESCELAGRWEQFEASVPPETTLYRELVRKHGLTDDLPDK